MNNSKISVLCSTGTMVGRENGFNYRRAIDILKDFYDRKVIAGGELMMLKHYYDKKDEVVNYVNFSGVPFPVIHCEKGVGTDLSHAAFLEHIGDYCGADELLENTFKIFRLNCSFGEAVGAKAMVLHLWGGEDSDSHVKYNCDKLSELFAIAASHGIRLLIENVPSTTNDPLSNWHRALDAHPGCGLIFDTRFATLHDQVKETLSDPLVQFNLCHVHVSDFVGGFKNFAALRPILHPLEGVVDFDLVTKLLHEMSFRGTVTLESPVICGDELDTQKLEASLKFISERF